MKHKHIELLLSEIQLLESKVENLKENNKVPFSFFKESFNCTQKITHILHELEFVQIEGMRAQMEKLVQFLSDVENSKEEAKIKSLAEENQKEKQQGLDISKIVEHKEEVAKDNKVPSHCTSVETSKEAIKSSSPLLNSKSESVLANSTAKNKSLNDVQPINQTIQDVKRSISLNDRFLFQRELFDNNREEMNTMLTKLQSFSSFDLVESYLKRNTNWDFRDETVDKFLQMLKDNF